MALSVVEIRTMEQGINAVRPKLSPDTLTIIAALASSARQAESTLRRQGAKEPAALACATALDAIAGTLHEWHEALAAPEREQFCLVYPGKGNGTKWYDTVTNEWGSPC